MGGGLIHRMVAASAALAVVIGVAFAVMLAATGDLHDRQRRAARSAEIVAVANQLERLTVDLETGERGFLITGEASFLEPWQAAQSKMPAEEEDLRRLVTADPVQRQRVDQIAADCDSYVSDYSVPLVTAARKDLAAARTPAAQTEGKRRTDAIRAQFDQLVGTEQDRAQQMEAGAEAASRRAFLAAVAGLVGSLLLIALYTGYLARAVVGPVRRVAAAAGRLAGGDLDARLPEKGVREIGVMGRSFNAMAGSLAANRDELAASRARIVAAADQARRRIERNLHDGIQQRLVSLLLDLRAAQAAPPGQADAQLDAIAAGLTESLDELREISRGIHPAILSQGGLVAGLKALARRSKVPVELALHVPGRLPEQVEVTAYYVVSEALTNATKHAKASVVEIAARAYDGRLEMTVRDDGVGGALPQLGSGLVGLTDRVQALDGTITVTSPPGDGTTIRIELPTGDH